MNRTGIGVRGLTLLGLGGTIGTGIFVMVGMAAHDVAGPAVTVSFLIAAVAVACSALCFADLSGRVGVEGAAYGYARAFAPVPVAQLVGWNLLIQYGIAAASVAQGWSHYAQDTLRTAGVGAPLPPALLAVRGDAPGGWVDLPAALAVLLVAGLVSRGFVVGARLNTLFLVGKLAVLALAIGLGVFCVRPENWVPFAPFGWGIRPSAGGGPPQGMLAGAGLACFAFLGFEAVTLFPGEARNPRRDIPRSIIACVAVCTGIYVVLAGVLTGMVPTDQIAVRAPVSEAFRQAGFPAAQGVVAVGALAAISSVLVVILLCFPRVVRAVAGESPWLGPALADPRKASLAAGAFVAVAAACAPLRTLGDLAVLATLCSFAFVAVLTLRLRWREGRRFGALAAPVGSIGLCALMAPGLSQAAWGGLLVWWALGAALRPVLVRRLS